MVAIYPRHHDIEQNQVWRIFSYRSQCLFAAASSNGTVAFRLKHGSQQAPVFGLVIYNQDCRFVQ